MKINKSQAESKWSIGDISASFANISRLREVSLTLLSLFVMSNVAENNSSLKVCNMLDKIFSCTQ